jgi:hypothetical protein
MSAVSEAEAVLFGDRVEVVACVDVDIPVWARLHAGVRVAHLARARLSTVVVTKADPQPVQCSYRALPVRARGNARTAAAAAPTAATTAAAAPDGRASSAPAHAVSTTKVDSGGFGSTVAHVGFALRVRVTLEYAFPFVAHLFVPERGFVVVGSPAFSRKTVLKSSSTRSARFLHTKKKLQSFSSVNV